MPKFDDYYSLESFLAQKGFSRPLWDIYDLEKENVKRERKRGNTGVWKAEAIILKWWNDANILYHPSLKSHRIPFFLMWHLKKEVGKIK